MERDLITLPSWIGSRQGELDDSSMQVANTHANAKTLVAHSLSLVTHSQNSADNPSPIDLPANIICPS